MWVSCCHRRRHRHRRSHPRHCCCRYQIHLRGSLQNLGGRTDNHRNSGWYLGDMSKFFFGCRVFKVLTSSDTGECARRSRRTGSANFCWTAIKLRIKCIGCCGVDIGCDTRGSGWQRCSIFHSCRPPNCHSSGLTDVSKGACRPRCSGNGGSSGSVDGGSSADSPAQCYCWGNREGLLEKLDALTVSKLH